MKESVYQFKDFLAEVNQEYKDFAMKIHNALQKDGYRIRIRFKTEGFSVSYSHPKTRRGILNFFMKRKNLYIRLYADNFHKYMDFMNSLPENMEKEMAKAKICKRLVNPENYNSKCIGYDLFIKDNHYQKCRYKCFQFEVNVESVPFIWEFIENERKERFTV